MPQIEEFLPISKAADYLKVSVDTLRRWEEQGKLHPLRTPGNIRRYRLEDLKAIKSGWAAPTAQQLFVKTQNDLTNLKNQLASQTIAVTLPPPQHSPVETEILEETKQLTRNTDKIKHFLFNLANQIKELKSVTEQVNTPPTPIPTPHPPLFSSQFFLKNGSAKEKLLFLLSRLAVLAGLLIVIAVVGMIFLTYRSLQPLVTKLNRIEQNANQPQTYYQEEKITEPIDLQSQELKVGSLTIGEGKTVFNNQGSIYFTGGLTGGYLDTNNQNAINNSSFEYNSSGKPALYNYADGATESNLFISSDTAYDGANALKTEITDPTPITIKPTYTPLLPHKHYTFSVYVKTLSVKQAQLSIGFETDKSVVTLEGTTDWQQVKFSKTFDEADTPEAGSFFITISPSAIGGSVYIDALQLETGTLASGYKPQLLTGDGILTVKGSALVPAMADSAALGDINHPFKEIHVNTADIIGNADILGNTDIKGDLTVGGIMNFDSISATGKVLSQTEGVFTGKGAGTKRLDDAGNLLNIASLRMVNNSLTDSSEGYLVASNGLAVGAKTTYAFAGNGNLTANEIKTSGDILLNTGGATTPPAVYFAGIGGYSNNPGLRVNKDSGKLEYRDENSSSWASLDSLKTSLSDTSLKLSATTGSGSVSMGETLTVAGGSGITTAASGNTLTITNVLGTSIDNSEIINSTLTFAKWSSNACTNGQIPVFNGTIWGCGGYSAGNGLSLVSNQFQLGGTLGSATTIAQGNNNLSFSLTGSGNFSVTKDSTHGLFIASNGSVGVGTSQPTTDLDVVGRANFRSAVTLATALQLGNNAAINLSPSTPTALTIGNNLMSFDTSNESVGIGTNIPSEKLEVNGGNLKVTGGSFIDDGTTLNIPDYVFNPDYPLLSFSQLNTFIKDQKHLPNVPDMNDKAQWASLSLQDRDMKLLEKTEENTLYLLQHEDRLNAMQQFNHSAIEQLSELRLASETINTAIRQFNDLGLTDSGNIFLKAESYTGLLENASSNSLEALSYSLTGTAGKVIINAANFNTIMAAGIKAGLVDTKNFIADTAVVSHMKVEGKLLIGNTDILAEIGKINSSIGALGNTSTASDSGSLSHQSLAINHLPTAFISPLPNEDLAVILDEANHNSKFVIRNSSSEVASIDSTGKASFSDLMINGNATISGTITANNAVLNHATIQQFNTLGDATVSGQLNASGIYTKDIYAQSARFQSLHADRLEAANISNLSSMVTSILDSSLSTRNDTYNDLLSTLESNQASLSAQLAKIYARETDSNRGRDIESLQQSLNLPDIASSSALLASQNDFSLDQALGTTNLDAETGLFNAFLGVSGTASIVNLNVTNTLAVLNTMHINGNSLSVLDGETNTLFFQPSGLGQVNILAGAVVIDSTGTIRVNGDLYLAGNFYGQTVNAKAVQTDDLQTRSATVSGSLFASLLKPVNGNVTIDLTSEKSASSSAISNQQLAISNSGKEVASIDASGSARFSAITTGKINVPVGTGDAPLLPENGEVSSSQLSAIADSIGLGKMKMGTTQVIIQAPAVTKDSFIFVTPTSSTLLPLSVTAKTAGQSFTVSIPETTNKDIQFNWWIIN